MNNIVLYAMIAIGLGAFGYFLWKLRQWGDIDIQLPVVLRNDLLFGYYGSVERTWQQVKDNVNLYWYFNFYPQEQFIEEIRQARPEMKFVVDIAPHLTERVQVEEGKTKLICSKDAEENLRAFFLKMQDAGVLHRFTYLYPVDEPQLNMYDAQEHLKMLEVAKKVAAEFPELKNVRWLVIYVAKRDFWNIDHYDVVGVDQYEQKSEILTNGEHARLLKVKLPHQKTILVPGCGFGQNPDPFVAYAHSYSNEVEIVAPFLWFEFTDPKNKDADFTGLENAKEDFREKWINAGWKVMNRERTTPVWKHPNPEIFPKSAVRTLKSFMR